MWFFSFVSSYLILFFLYSIKYLPINIIVLLVLRNKKILKDNKITLFKLTTLISGNK